MPVSTPRGSAFTRHLQLSCGRRSGWRRFLCNRQSLAIDGEIGAIHAAQIAAAALFGRDYVGRMVPLGVESRGESQHFGRAELDAKATGFATLHHNGNTSFCHGTPTLEVLGTPKTLDNYVVPLSQWGVTGITSASDLAQTGAALETRAVECFYSILVIPSAGRNRRGPATGKNEIPRCGRNDKVEQEFNYSMLNSRITQFHGSR